MPRLRTLVTLCLSHLVAVSADFAFAAFDSSVAAASALSLVGTANVTGPRLRLTSPVANAAGAVWHTVPQLVEHGFTTEILFRALLDDPSQVAGPCRVVDHAPDACERHPGDGIAFVLQRSAGSAALGLPAGGMGYSGLPGGALAVELDLWSDADLRDPGDNHVAVMTRGAGALRSDHATAIGSMTTPLELGDGNVHVLKVVYKPQLSAGASSDPAFKASPHLASLIYPVGVPYRHSLGSLSMYVDADAQPPVGATGIAAPPATLIVPLPLDVLLASGLECESAMQASNAPNATCSAPGQNITPPPPPPPPAVNASNTSTGVVNCCPPGHAWVGITAATGQAVAAFEVLSWTWTSERAMQ